MTPVKTQIADIEHQNTVKSYINAQNPGSHSYISNIHIRVGENSEVINNKTNSGKAAAKSMSTYS